MSSRQDIYEFILDHYENPRNRGSLSPADVVMKGGNPTCGDIVTLYLKIDPATQRIEALRFTGEGCTISQAAASLTTEQVQGRSVTQARGLRAPDLLDELGDAVLRNRRRCATLALHTLRAALSHYLQQRALPVPPAGDLEEPATGLRFEEQSGEGE